MERTKIDAILSLFDWDKEEETTSTYNYFTNFLPPKLFQLGTEEETHSATDLGRGILLSNFTLEMFY